LKEEKKKETRRNSEQLLQFFILLALGIFTFVVFISMGIEKFKTRYISGEVSSMVESPTIPLKQYKKFPKIGTLLLARFGQGEYFFFGKVEEIDRKKNMVKIKYLDGDEEWKTIHELRYDTIKPGYRVEVRLESESSWLPGTILDRIDDLFTIRLDIDGKEVKVKAVSIRVKERLL